MNGNDLTNLIEDYYTFNGVKFSKGELAQKLGDAIMILIVAGLAEGVDPLKDLEEKIRTKMEQSSVTKRGTANAWGTYLKETTFDIKGFPAGEEEEINGN